MRFADGVIKVASEDDVFACSGCVLQKTEEIFDESFLGVDVLFLVTCEAMKVVMKEILRLLLIVEGIVSGCTIL